MDIFHALSDTVNDGGGTYDVFLYTPETEDAAPYELVSLDRFYLSYGYIVGGNVPSAIFPVTSITLEDISSFVSSHSYYWGRDELRGSGSPETYRLGTWLHNGDIHLDVVSHINDRDKAIEIGLRRGELAIYDLNDDSDIDLTSPEFDELREEIQAEQRLTGED